MPEFIIRLATSGDLPALADLSFQLGYPVKLDRMAFFWERLRHNPAHAVYVAETPAGRVKGWLHVAVYDLLMEERQAYIQGLVVDENYRGRGAGRALLQRAEIWAAENGCRKLRVNSNTVRLEAHAFYRRLGFHEVKTQLVLIKEI